MAAIAIKDLSTDRALDRKAMAAIKGAGAPWVYGWIRPFTEARPSFVPVINFYQISNTFVADQMVVQFQDINVTNSAANSTVGVAVDATGAVSRQQ
jgi:hypothetical protein